MNSLCIVMLFSFVEYVKIRKAQLGVQLDYHGHKNKPPSNKEFKNKMDWIFHN
jgi:hypothetical protein